MTKPFLGQPLGIFIYIQHVTPHQPYVCGWLTPRHEKRRWSSARNIRSLICWGLTWVDLLGGLELEQLEQRIPRILHDSNTLGMCSFHGKTKMLIQLGIQPSFLMEIHGAPSYDIIGLKLWILSLLLFFYDDDYYYYYIYFFSPITT